MRDYIFKPRLLESGSADATHLKKELAAALGDRVVDGKTKYLFSSEPLIDEQSGWFRLRIMEGTPPEGMRQIDLSPPAVGQMTTLSAWIALGSNMFKGTEPRSIFASRCRKRLEELCHDRFPAVLDLESATVADEIRVMKAVSKGSKLHRPYGHVTVTGRVSDSTALDFLLRNGIGDAKAYGFGLIATRNVH